MRSLGSCAKFAAALGLDRGYRYHNKIKVMTLAADEFIRRFLLHALPDGFHRIRHYGFLANRGRADKLALCRSLLAPADADPPAGDEEHPRRAALAACRTGV
jgi:Putative transposase